LREALVLKSLMRKKRSKFQTLQEAKKKMKVQPMYNNSNSFEGLKYY